MKKLPEELIRSIRDCRDAGMRKKDVAAHLNITHTQVRSACQIYNISGWPVGAAARNQRGIYNPNYINGLSRGVVNRLTRKTLIEEGRDLYTCERCGATRNVAFPRHHKDRNRGNNTSSNLEVLCIPCHNKEHMQEKLRNKGRFLR